MILLRSNTLQDENLDRWSLVDLKKEALSITKPLQNVKLAKVNRRVNEVAHQIAKFHFHNWSEGILCNSLLLCMANA